MSGNSSTNFREKEAYLRPTLYKQLDDEQFTCKPENVPIPRMDRQLSKPPDSTDLDSVEEQIPEIKETEETIATTFAKSKNMTAKQYKQIKEFLSISSYYRVPGFESYLNPLDRMFLNPTKTGNKLAKQNKLVLYSDELQQPIFVTKLTAEESLKALEISRKTYLAEKFRAQGKEEEAKAIEEDRYDIFKSFTDEPLKQVSGAVNFFLELVWQRIWHKTN